MTKLRSLKQQVWTVLEKPEWVSRQEALGNTIIHNAARPLHGTAVENTWQMPFLRGRHWAAISPDDPEAEWMIQRNKGMDAYRVVFCDKDQCIDAALAWVRDQYGNAAADRVKSRMSRDDENWLIDKGLEIFENG